MMIAFYLAIIDDHKYDSKFERIYSTYEKKMFSVAISITQDFYIAEEVLQDTFVIVAKQIADIEEDNEEMLKSLLYKITKNIAIDYLRKRSREEKIVSIDKIENSVPCENNCTIETKELYDTLVAKIKEMPEIYRDILVMNLVYGMSKTQIANLLGKNVNTVSSRIKRGKAMLKKYMEEGETNCERSGTCVM